MYHIVDYISIRKRQFRRCNQRSRPETIGQKVTYTSHPHMSPAECIVVEKLIDDLLAAGLYIRIYEGEAFAPETPRPITDKAAIWKGLASTESDQVFVYQPVDGGPHTPRPLARIGWVSLVYGNDQYVISDFTVNLAGEGSRQGEANWMAGAQALADSIDAAGRPVVTLAEGQ